MMNKAFQFAFLFFASSFLILGQSCNSATKEEKTEITENDSLKKEEPSIEFDHKFDDIARILAGMDVDKNSAYYAVSQSASWQNYKKQADASWASAETKRFKAMRDWSEKELAEVNKLQGDLFYPFSGPDIYYSYQFFPSASNYHLFALEPAGNLAFLKNENANWDNICSHVFSTIDDFISGGFFHTKHMRLDMKDMGTLPTLMVFLVRGGNTITNVENVVIKDDGTVAKSETDLSSVRIDFLDSKTKKQKSMFYHSCDISDQGFAKRPALKKHIEQVAANRTFTKSASYLMHRPDFAQVRDIILNKAVSVFQDDTAVPFSFYSNDKWNKTLYGKYLGPIKLFEVRFQKDLMEAYKSKDVKALPFTLGYHSDRDYDNMMLFVKK